MLEYLSQRCEILDLAVLHRVAHRQLAIVGFANPNYHNEALVVLHKTWLGKQ